MWQAPPGPEGLRRGRRPARPGSGWSRPSPPSTRRSATAASLPKLDDQAIYEVRLLRHAQAAPPGHEHCPPTVFCERAVATVPAGRADGPAGHEQAARRRSPLPDLRRLAARAGQPMGPGGVQITHAAEFAARVQPVQGHPDGGDGRLGAGGRVCTFALELFFIVAFFLFLMFLPIVVFAFQLWWMLAPALLPPAGLARCAVTQFFAGGHLADCRGERRVVPPSTPVRHSTATQLAGAAHGDRLVDQLKDAKDRTETRSSKTTKPFVDALLTEHRRRLAVARPPAPAGVDARRPALRHGAPVP